MVLLDANIFIEAHRRYYGMDICEGFWVWLDRAKEAGTVGSIVPVCDELAAGNDVLKDWADTRSDNGWFFDVTDSNTQNEFIGISNFVSMANYKPEAKAAFLDVADPWLIAKAKSIGATVVTHESHDSQIRRKVLIPNVCVQFGVPFINTFDLLRHHTANFVLA